MGARVKYSCVLLSCMTLPRNEPPEGRRFRSWGEEQIARLLDRNRIAFLYEHPLAVVDGGKTRIWYADFRLCGYGMLIEYCGRPDDPAYAAGMARKEAVYRVNGLTALMLTPEDLRGDWPGRILGRIEGVLTDRLKVFRDYRRAESVINPRRNSP